jgi:hypothetical protein
MGDLKVSYFCLAAQDLRRGKGSYCCKSCNSLTLQALHFYIEKAVGGSPLAVFFFQRYSKKHVKFPHPHFSI